MMRFRALASLAHRVLAGTIAPFRPTPGTTEGAVMLGLALLAAGFLAAGLVPFALGVPGGLLVVIGLGFSLRRAR